MSHGEKSAAENELKVMLTLARTIREQSVMKSLMNKIFCLQHGSGEEESHPVALAYCHEGHTG